MKNFQGPPPPARYVFISRVATGNPNVVADFLNSKKIIFNKIERKSHPDSKYKSFKISMFKDQINTVLSNNFWPRGVLCKIWKEPDNRLSSDNCIIKNQIYSPNESRYVFNKNMNRQYNIGSLDNNRSFNSNSRI